MIQAINSRVQALRDLLSKEGIQAFLLPSTDPHLSEYVAPHWESRKWISGFTGSAGTVVITTAAAGLWTDSRYFLQAAQQLEGTGIRLYKEMLPETPTLTTFLLSQLKPGDAVGIDGSLFPMEEVERMEAELGRSHITLRSMTDPLDKLWTDRPPMPQGAAFIHETKYAGKSTPEKIAALRAEMKREGASCLLLSALDEIAWTLNLRGSDVHCTPVVISYLLLGEQDAHLFIDAGKVTPAVAAYLEETGIERHPYEEIKTFLHTLSAESILLHPAKTNYSVYAAIPPHCRIVRGTSPATLLKAIRNPQEIAGIHAAMQRDGVALVRFLKWLEEAVPAGKETEISISQKLQAFRSQQALYKGESFDTIAGYRAHGAIIHYSATPESDLPLRSEGFLLLDSGAQYLDGTTDITRTIALGALTEEEKTDYTLVLKGHIALSMAQFPAGTRGAQLDVLARMPIWQRGMNYLYGTGHGVGHFLGVHEGPQSIRMNENPVPLQPGMVTSNEPGVYKPGSHGIRTENLLLVVPAAAGMYGNYLKFETLTLCPVCTKGIRIEMLAREEIAWLNEYHANVFAQLSPALDSPERKWLEEATRSI